MTDVTWSHGLNHRQFKAISD